MVYPAYEAALRLEQEGINLTVVNARFAKPLDEELINKLIKDHPFIITLEEHSVNGGFGSAVLELATNRGWTSSKIKCLGIPDKFIPHGPREVLLSQCGLDVPGIIQTVKKINHR
jgi:1-deoxy-D-xylulose-5-phosphate synthase